jgi:transposase
VATGDATWCSRAAKFRADRRGAPAARLPAPPIEVELAGAVLRIRPGTDGDLLTMVLRAIRASAA